MDDDYFTNNDDDKPARGAWMEVRNGTGVLVWEGYTDWSGSNAGCTDQVSLDTSNNPYRFKLFAGAKVQGNYLGVYEDDDTPPTMWTSDWQNFNVSTSKYLYTSTLGPHKAWNVAAAVGWALARRPVGTQGDGETFRFYTCPCTTSGLCNPAASGGGNCHKANSRSTYIVDSGYKSYIAHEFGHQLAEYRDADRNAAGAGSDERAAYDQVDSDCPDPTPATNSTPYPHWLTSAEPQSVGIWEGLANYYAGVSWNVTTSDECELLWKSGLDWNNDGLTCQGTGCNGDAPWSCAGAPEVDSDTGDTGVTLYADGDHYGSYCVANDPALQNVGTELDWARFFWDLDHVEGLDTTDLFDMYDQADPWDWDWDETTSAISDDPRPRLEDAADFLGFATEWDNQEFDNGVWR